MPSAIRESGHLFRLLGVFVAAIVAFLLLRSALVPHAFGQYGHYRPGALDDNQKRVPRHAGQAACLDCHDVQATLRKAGKHAKVSCEACHGPHAAHAEDPTIKPPPPHATVLCKSCHEKDAAKPKWFPQVNSGEHNAGVDCNSCHQAHKPGL